MKNMNKSLFVVFAAMVILLSFSMVAFSHGQNVSAGNKSTTMTEKSGGHKELGKMETATGKVISVDPEGKAITISEKIGGNKDLVVGTIVSDDTTVKVSGKEATLSDIKVGDRVTIHYVKSDDLYAKEVIMG